MTSSSVYFCSTLVPRHPIRRVAADTIEFVSEFNCRESLALSLATLGDSLADSSACFVASSILADEIIHHCDRTVRHVVYANGESVQGVRYLDGALDLRLAPS
jgi:hypothetical protein